MTAAPRDPGSPLRVLLLSPSPGVDVPCGDVTYTEVLLADPPPGVVYTPYPDALRNGSLRELSSRSGWSGARTARWKGAWYLGVSAAANRIRRTGLAFREPIRVFEVDAGAFDLIHVHVFSIRFVGEHPPIVASSACPLRYLYRDAFGWPMWRVRAAEAFDAALATVLRADRNMYRLRRAARAIPFTEPQAEAYRRSSFPAERIDVIPIPVRDEAALRDATRRPTTIGFVAKDFDAKGGNEVLEAFDRLRSEHPELRLVIAGSPPRLSPEELHRRNITWIPYVERHHLLTKVLPEFDILAYPTHFDGLPFVVVEAMSAGIPVVSSDYLALPSIVAEAGLSVPARAPDVAGAIRVLLDPERHRRAAVAARTRYENVFHSEVVVAQLGASYRRARDASTRPT